VTIYIYIYILSIFLFSFSSFPLCLFYTILSLYFSVSSISICSCVEWWNNDKRDSRMRARSRNRNITPPSSPLSLSLFPVCCLKYITASAPDAPADGSRVQRPPRHETGTSSALLRCRLHSRIHGDPVFQLRRCSYNRIVSEGRIFISIFILRLLLLTQ